MNGDRYATIAQFQPTLPARGATYNSAVVHLYKRAISTHAPRTGSDSAK